MRTEPINTNVRLFDLVRYARIMLHEDDLITDDEYAWLCAAPMAQGPGSPSPRRLEDYDELRQRERRLVEALAVCQPFFAEDMPNGPDDPHACATLAYRDAYRKLLAALQLPQPKERKI